MTLPRHTPMLTVADLIEKLQALPSDAIVVQSRDTEGNGFSPVSEVTLRVYQEETTWNGEFTDHEDDIDDMRDGGAVPAVCVWPTN